MQSVLSDAYECRAELGGCGAEFDRPAHRDHTDTASVEQAIAAMHEAICRFENREFPLGQQPMVEMRSHADELLAVLKHEIGRISTVIEEQ
ncbi:MAG: hypothetical protein IID40_02585 [Planctomycetes bacterium]|nr:hypothetical protein [Planctomycetota bacterium]